MEKIQESKPIRISYESNRLAESYLLSAYEKLITIIKRPIKTKYEIENNDEGVSQKLKGNSR